MKTIWSLPQMNHAKMPGAIIFFGIFALACESTPKEPESITIATQHVDAARDEAKESVSSAATAVKKYSYAERDDFIAKMNTEISSLEGDVGRLADDAGKSGKKLSADAEAKIAVAREKWSAAKEKLELAKTATEDHWAEAQDGLDRAQRELKASIDDSRRWVADKIEPAE